MEKTQPIVLIQDARKGHDIEGPLDSDEPLEWLSIIVITDKKWGDG